MSADAFTAHGIDASGVIFDELHTQKDRALWDSLIYSGTARRQPLLVAISTAGWDRHSICFEQHTHAVQVLDGTIRDDSFFAYIRAADVDDDWTDPAVHAECNPSLGVIFSAEDLASACTQARESPARENAFRRYRLCQWTEQEIRWITMEKWDQGGDELDIDLLKGRQCFAGLDLATTTDLTALVLLFPDDDGGYTLLPFFWAPEDNARLRSRRDRVPYMSWAQQGFLTLTPGDVTDYSFLRRDINDIADRYSIRGFGIDRLFQGVQLGLELKDDGLPVEAVGMGFLTLAAPTAELERLVLAGKLRHGANPIMRWMIANATVEMDAAGNIKPSKVKSCERIDGVTATVIALAVAGAVGPAKRSVYEDRGLITLNLNE